MVDLGVLVPMVTPCHENGTVDIEGVKQVAQYSFSSGASSIFVCGSTGRGPWFSINDQMDICRAVAGCANSEHKIFCGCMANGLADMLDKVEHMADVGAQIAVVTAPGYFNYQQSEIEYIFHEFADRSKLPVLLYDIPDFAGVKLGTSLIDDLAHHENVIGLKDSSNDMIRFNELLNMLGDIPNFFVLQGKEPVLAQSVLNGASGIVISLFHINPIPFVRVYEYAKAQDAAAANNVQLYITRVFELVMECFDKRPGFSTLMHILNYCLKSHGVTDNILMPHEGMCPDWLSEKSEKMMSILDEAAQAN